MPRAVTDLTGLAAFLGTGNAVTVAAAAGASYYVGALVGLQLRLPPATPSVLWPPNAILTAFLLFVPVRHWWSVLLGAAIAHFAVQLQVWSPGFVTAIFLSNCSEALLAAGVIRYVSDEPARFDTLRRVAILLVSGGLVAPFVSSFIDAGVVRMFHGEDYWTVWRIRFPSNVLAQLAIVPAIAAGLNWGHSVREWSWRRWLEATAIAGGLVLVAVAVSLDAGRIGLSRAPLAPFLSLLLWAAVRFGSGGVGLSVLATVLVAVVSVLYGGGLFQEIPPEDRIGLLQVSLISATVPLMCVGALVEERQRVAGALRASDALKASILASIPSLVAVVSREGLVVAVNESWMRTPRLNGLATALSSEPGAFGEDVRAPAHQEPVNGRATYDGIKRVLDGSASGFTLEYSCDGAGVKEWWLMSVVPLKSAEGGAVITHTDITAQKRAELDAQRSRDELAHATRVWVMGELSASLSHQLSQPLTGIIGNAHAGRRFLEGDPPNLVEVRQILDDIVSDADRASDVIRAVREMLRKDAFDPELVDVNHIVRDVATLATSEAVTRNVSLRLALAESLPLVPGSRVQLSQVVLNLIMNAIEATTRQVGADGGMVIVRTEPDDATGIQVSVVDNGHGLPRGAEGEIFEPLFTTKESGMGMGLTIARSIIEAHGGMVWAHNSHAGGVAVHFTLPLSRHERSEPARPQV
jgi:two-component system, LuxR family, sensor kinase FixL